MERREYDEDRLELLELLDDDDDYLLFLLLSLISSLFLLLQFNKTYLESIDYELFDLELDDEELLLLLFLRSGRSSLRSGLSSLLPLLRPLDLSLLWINRFLPCRSLNSLGTGLLRTVPRPKLKITATSVLISHMRDIYLPLLPWLVLAHFWFFVFQKFQLWVCRPWRRCREVTQLQRWLTPDWRKTKDN